MATELHLTFLVTPPSGNLLPAQDWERKFYDVFREQSVRPARLVLPSQAMESNASKGSNHYRGF